MKMSYVITRAFLLVGAVQCSALQYCSERTKPAMCVPCGGKALLDTYKCPKQCGNGKSLNLCDTECSDRCINSECEYEDDGYFLKCSKGCNRFYHGSYCQELCNEGCVRCSQNGTLCFECEQGRFGDRCEQKCGNCRGEKCDRRSGVCSDGCEPGFYGEQCDRPCDHCKQCDDASKDCEVCDQSDGTCKMGCSYGYYGVKCDIKCEPKCTQCHVETGACEQCELGWFGSNCSLTCQNCRNERCSFSGGRCTDGCTDGFQLQGQFCEKVETVGQDRTEGTITEKAMKQDGTGDKVTEKAMEKEETEDTVTEKAMEQKHTNSEADREESSSERDYLLPAVVCLLAFCALIALVGIWKYIRSNVRCNRVDQKNGLEGWPPNQEFRKPTAPLYDEIMDQQNRNLLKPERPQKPLPSERPYLLRLNGTPFSSMQYMTPLNEGQDEENVFGTPRTGTFSFDPIADSDRNNGRVSPVSMAFEGAGQAWHSTRKIDLVFENEPGPSSCHANNPAVDSFSLHSGQHQAMGSYEVPVEYLETSQSGRSTPRYLTMYPNCAQNDKAETEVTTLQNTIGEGRREVSEDLLRKALLRHMPTTKCPDTTTDGKRE